MAKPRVFISSTFYDLRQIRANLDLFIEQIGYEPVRNEEGDIPYGKEESLEEYCYKEIKMVDIFVSIIGGRFGTKSKKATSSISQIELKTALSEGKQVYIFIDKNVLSEYETYLLNKDIEAKFKYVDDSLIYEFIEEIKTLKTNNVIHGFETASDITKYLKEQFAGLFQRFLEEQARIKEVSLIKGLEKTAQTLNKLVNYLSTENKDQSDEINRILTINHPLVERLKNDLDIPYNFYIEGLADLSSLLQARSFQFDEEFDLSDILDSTDSPFDSVDSENMDEKSTYDWIKKANRKKYHLKISKDIFDEEDKLKFIKKSDWQDDLVTFNIDELPANEVDDLPF